MGLSEFVSVRDSVSSRYDRDDSPPGSLKEYLPVHLDTFLERSDNNYAKLNPSKCQDIKVYLTPPHYTHPTHPTHPTPPHLQFSDLRL